MSVVSIPPRRAPFPPLPVTAARPGSGAASARRGGDEYTVGQGSLSAVGGDDAEAAESRAQLHTTLQRMAQYMRKTRLQLAPFFHDFDRHRQGALSWSQFARVLVTAGFPALTHALVENVSAHYALPSDPAKVSYKAFIADVEAIAAAQTQQAHDAHTEATQGPTLDFQRTQQERPMMRTRDDDRDGAHGPNSARPPFAVQHDRHPAHSPLTAQKLLHKIQTISAQKRLVLSDLFADFDPLRKNVVTLQRFRRALDNAGFQLSDAEANILVGDYLSQRDANQVEYKRFIHDVQAPFIPPNPETSPLAELPRFEPYRLEEHETAPAQLTAAEEARVQQILSEMGYQVHTRRILVRPGFQLHDHTRSGCVTSRQFHSVLASTFPMVRLSTRDVDMLADKYRRGDIGVCYTAFVKDVEAGEREAGEYAKTLHPSHAAAALEATQGIGAAPGMQPLARNGPAVVAGMRIVGSRAEHEAAQAKHEQSLSAQDVLARISAALARTRMNIDDTFKDYDGLNKGRVTRAQFFRALTQVGLKLSAADVHALTTHYPHPDPAFAHDSVDTRAFLRDIHAFSAPQF